MPYASTSELPAGVKKGLSESEQRQFMHIVNKCLADGKDEGACFKQANGVVKGKKEAEETGGLIGEFVEVQLADGTKSYQYVSSWEVQERGYTQTEASYNPVGGLASGEQACANCRWFIAPGACAIVSGEISPTGRSDLWTAKSVYEQQPILVQIVKEAGQSPTSESSPQATSSAGNDAQPGSAQKVAGAAGSSGVSAEPGVVAKISAWFTEHLKALSAGMHRSAEAPVLPAGFWLKETAGGQLRWFARMTNNFQDRDGETFTAEAHKEYVEWAWDNKQFPELWLWHIPGSRFGSTDWLEYSDGFVHASGLIDEGGEVVAKALAQSKEEIGVSHGFVCLKQADGTIIKYRSYELSPLAAHSAANSWTAFDILGTKESDMAFTDNRRNWLKGLGVGEDQIKQWEADTEKLATTLKETGVSFKSTLEEQEAQAAVAQTQQTDALLAVEVANLTKAVTETVTTLQAQVKQATERAEAAEELAKKSRDQIVTEEFTARSSAGNGAGFSPTASQSTVVADGQKAAGSGSSEPLDWFAQTVVKSLPFAQTPPAPVAQ